MNAELITIGDELLLGQIINSNAATIGEKLAGIGIHLRRMTTVGDDRAAILDALRMAWDSRDVVLTTGGLGPTHDDVTRAAVSEFFQSGLIQDRDVLADIHRFFERRGRPVTPVHEDQALIPGVAVALRNPVGTAPGLRIERDGKFLFVMPGVPIEMNTMLDSHVLPSLAGRSSRIIRSLTLQTTGIFESNLAHALGNVEDLVGTDSLAFLPGTTGVRIRVTVSSADEKEAERKIDAARSRILEKAGSYVYGYGEEQLEEVIGRLLRERGMTLATAESCTGGLIAHRVTNVPGSSTYFLRGIIAYSNEAKIEELRVDPDLIEKNGAVSAEVAAAMAEGIRAVAGSSIGLSVTGIAGPTGATAVKPVGFVWIGYSDVRRTETFSYSFGDQRIRNKERSAQTALEILRRQLLGLPVDLY